MATNLIQKGDLMPYTNSTGSAIASGKPVPLCGIVGVAQGDIANGAAGTLAVVGVYELNKATGAIAQGAAVYWDADGNPVSGDSGSGACTTTSSGNTPAGFAFAAAGSSDATVKVKLNG